MSDSNGNPSDEPHAPGEETARRAAEAATDGGRLLPGENPQTTDPADAARWLDVYAELLTLKQELLRLMLVGLAELRQEPARREVEETDAVVLRSEAERLARRIDFWRGRRDELS